MKNSQEQRLPIVIDPKPMNYVGTNYLGNGEKEKGL
jgi:hypothetical protein